MSGMFAVFLSFVWKIVSYGEAVAANRGTIGSISGREEVTLLKLLDAKHFKGVTVMIGEALLTSNSTTS